MADETQARKLATIVALDVAGYSARTEADEARTTAEIASLRKVIEAIAAKHGGRVFNTAGDGFMLEFGSSMAAVQAAFELAETCEPKVRVGVHVGDVVPQANGDVLGHGVNIAARLMAQAAPGSVMLTAAVKHMMRGPLLQSLRPKGPIKLAKMNETIEVFAYLPGAPLQRDLRARLDHLWTRKLSRFAARAAMAGGALAFVAAIAAWAFLPLNDGADLNVPVASIAVLPFENLSSDKDGAFFAVGIQDEILTRLAKIGSLKVISRTSTAHLASRPDNVPEIAKQLGVANVLEGSVQREGDKVRVNVQLIKAATDDHLWAEIYDRKLDNIFSVQSEIAVSVAAALRATVTAEEKKAIAFKSTNDPKAYEAYLRGLSMMHQNAGMSKAGAFFREAVELDPKFALAWSYLARQAAQTYSRRESTQEQKDLARTALDTAMRLAPDLPEVQLAQGFYIYYVEDDFVRARQQFEKVHAKWPNEIESFRALGAIARRQSLWEESKSYYEQAVALDPLRADLRLDLVGVLVSTRDFPTALERVDDALARWPEDLRFISEKVNILQRLGLLNEAGALLKPLRTRSENFITRRLVSQAVLQRQYAEAINVLQAQLAQTGDEALAKARVKLDLSRVHRLAGDAAASKTAAEEARTLLLAEFERQPANDNLLTSLAWAFCYLGDRKEAASYLQKAVALSPTANARLDDIQMRIWATFGDRDRAIPALERLQKMPNGYYTAAILRLDPVFDPLRGDMRFDALIAQAAKGS